MTKIHREFHMINENKLLTYETIMNFSILNYTKEDD